eukprot:gene19624-23468_t
MPCGSEEIQQENAQAGAIPRLMELLSDVSEAEVKVSATGCWGMMATDSEKMKQRIVQAGAAPRLVELLGDDIEA